MYQLTKSGPNYMRRLPKIASIALIGVALCACVPSMPRVHKVTVQQGNVITQDMINKLKPGMTRSQVAFIMGEPVLRNTFNEDRWDYLYTFELPGRLSRDTRVSLYFENDVLAYFTGDVAPTEAQEKSRQKETANVETPATSTNDSRSESPNS